MKLKPGAPIYVKSDRFFNDPDGHKFFEEMGQDVQPVDAYGGFVPPQWRKDPNDLSNLSKTQKAIRQRFQLDPLDVEEGGESKL